LIDSIFFVSFENSRRLQEKHKADKFNNLGKVKWELALSLLIVFIVVYFALWKGIKSSGKVRSFSRREYKEICIFFDKVVWVTAITPYAVLFILLIRGLTLKGASLGINFYLTPQWELLKHMKVRHSNFVRANKTFILFNDRFGMLRRLRSFSH
jgi:SNF family Na+-dependent transporter